MAFLEIITRCYKRPKMLQHNQASIEAQTCDDWEQLLIFDDIGNGIGWAQTIIADYADELTGDYVWVLDDDDMCTRDTLIYELKQIADVHNPDVIMVRFNHMDRGILPDGLYWKSQPVECHIGVSCYIVKRDVFQKHASAFKSARYQSDLDFIQSVYADNPSVFWHDVIAGQVQRISLGEPETA